MSSEPPPERAPGVRGGEVDGASGRGRLMAAEKIDAEPPLHYALLFLPAARRQAAVPLYALWRELREINHECREPEVARAKLGWWLEEIEALYLDRARHPIAAALAPVIRRYRLPAQPFLELIQALAQHTARSGYRTHESLRAHGTATRGRVEALAARLTEGADAETAEWASGLGAALEIAELLAETGGDAARGRVYLPLEDLMRFGVSPRELQAGRATEPIRGLLAFEAERLADELKHDLAIVPPAQRSRLLPTLIAAAIARAGLEGLRRRPERVLHRRPQPAPLRQLWIAWRTARKARAA